MVVVLGAVVPASCEENNLKGTSRTNANMWRAAPRRSIGAWHSPWQALESMTQHLQRGRTCHASLVDAELLFCHPQASTQLPVGVAPEGGGRLLQ